MHKNVIFVTLILCAAIIGSLVWSLSLLLGVTIAPVNHFSSWADTDSEYIDRYSPYMAPSRWDVRYCRTGARSGSQIQLLGAVKRGVWTCIGPDLQVTSVNLYAKSGVSSTPRGGIEYRMVPPLDMVQKQVAVTASDALVIRGVDEAALGPYLGGGDP